MSLDRSNLGLILILQEHPGCSIWLSDPGRSPLNASSPWLCADVQDGPCYAIWKATGAVHRVQEEGEEFPQAVTDDPVMVPE